MHLVRRRLPAWCAFVVALQLSVLGTAAMACCQSGCEMDHAVAAAAESHDAEMVSGAHCPMPHHTAATTAAAGDASLTCGCDKDRAVDLLLSPTALLVSGASLAADITPTLAPSSAIESLVAAPQPPFVPPPRA